MRSKIYGILLAGTLFVAVASPVLAHHSFGAEFDGTKTSTFQGVITKIEWINPHVYINVDVKDASGAVTPWAFETLPTGFLHRLGITKELLMGTPGQPVTILANPAKDGTKALGWALKLTYPDGHSYTLAGGNDLPPGERPTR